MINSRIFATIIAFFTTLSVSISCAQSTRIALEDGSGSYTLYSSSHALLIDQVHYESWPDLPQASESIGRFSGFLERRGFEVQRLSNISSSQLLSRVHSFLTSLPENSRAIVYIRSHGAIVQRSLVGDRAGQRDQPETPKGRPLLRTRDISYLVGPDAALLGEDGPGPDFYSASLSEDTLRFWSLESQAKHTLFMLDACFSGNFQDQGISSGVPPITVSAFEKPFIDLSFLKLYAGRSSWLMTSASDADRTPANAGFLDAFVAAASTQADQLFVDDQWLNVGISSVTDIGHHMGIMSRGLTPRYPNLKPGFGPMPSFESEDRRVRGSMIFRSDAGLAARVAVHESAEEKYVQRLPDTNAPGSLLVSLQEADDQSNNYYNAAIGEYDPRVFFGGVHVKYFRKLEDGSNVVDALRELGIPYEILKPIENVKQTNGLACPPEADPRILQALLQTLYEYGVPVKYVKTYRRRGLDEARRRYRFEVLSSDEPDVLAREDLTLAEIMTIKTCPEPSHGYYGRKSND